jgi:hypothetical protein
LLIIGILLILTILAACGGGDDNGDSTDNNAEDTTDQSVLETTPDTDTPEAETLAATPEVVSTAVPTVGPTLTPTLSFQSWRVAGDWSINFRYVITNGGPFSEVDEWVYSGQAAILIEEGGNVTGDGLLYPIPFDEMCIVSTQDGEGYPFTVSGTLYSDGEHILMDIVMSVVDYFEVEDYTLLCPDYLEPRSIQNNFIWPALSQINRLTYTFWLDEGSFEIEFSEDLGLRTNRVLLGILNGELLLQR